jgi:exodeoxyribonuclease VII large subunit
MNALPLSQLINEIDEALQLTFGFEVFWIKAELVDVKKQASKGWCFAKLIEKTGAGIVAEIRANFWQPGYMAIVKFEKATGIAFEDGLEVICAVRVRFHARYGLSLDVIDIDVSHALGNAELDRQRTLQKLVDTYPDAIREYDGEYSTPNKRLALPQVIQRIALITAINSDGQRDFLQELHNTTYGYKFEVNQFLTTVQGNDAHKGLLTQLSKIRKATKPYDVVCIVRGGGSQTDFKPFDEYEFAEAVALYQTPILTGIGHDRNTSIADMMATQLKTPTKVAAQIIEHNMQYEQHIVGTYDAVVMAIGQQQRRAEHQLQIIAHQLNTVAGKIIAREKQRWLQYPLQLESATSHLISQAKQQLNSYQNTISLLDPSNVLQKGYAILRKNGKIVNKAEQLQIGDEIQANLHQHTITSTVNQIK